MGWISVFGIHEIFATLPPGGLILLASGGLCYTLGVLFFLWDSLPYNHLVWHFFVLGGSVSHYFAVFFYVLPVEGESGFCATGLLRLLLA